VRQSRLDAERFDGIDPGMEAPARPSKAPGVDAGTQALEQARSSRPREPIDRVEHRWSSGARTTAWARRAPAQFVLRDAPLQRDFLLAVRKVVIQARLSKARFRKYRTATRRRILLAEEIHQASEHIGPGQRGAGIGGPYHHPATVAD
jgi:hypothetical protein